MFGYNRVAFLQTNGAVDTMVSTNNTNINDWRKEVINEYKGLKEWPTFGNGWTNRTEDELELYFYNDYRRTH